MVKMLSTYDITKPLSGIPHDGYVGGGGGSCSRSVDESSSFAKKGV